MVEIKHEEFVWCRSNYPLSKLIVDNGLDDLWNNRSSDTKSRIDRINNDTSNTKTNHIMVYFTDYYNAISIDRLPLKTKIRKDS